MKRKSNKALADWKGSLTTFKGFTGVYPVTEIDNQGWTDIVNLIRPEKPAYITDKKTGQYFVPCLLKDAPLVCNTLKNAEACNEPTTGKMRSKSHVTEAAMLVMDIDGLPEADFFAGLDKIKSDGITYLAYSTYSHGNPAKPGMRARLVIPLDRALNSDEYAAAWHGFDNLYWDGQAGKVDSSGANLYQQQGTWCCDPNRMDQALSWENNEGVGLANALITSSDSIQSIRATIDAKYPPSDANKIAEACNQIKMFRDNKGANQSEPLWFDCLGVVGHCEDGANISQLWSSGYAGYDETKATEKLVNRMKLPPTTCQQFRKTNSDGCNGCNQNCNSPITLGREDFEAINTTKQDDKAVIARLAGLKPMDYDRVRNEEAKALGIQVKILDAEVKAARNRIDESAQLPFPDVEPYPDAIDPAQLLDEISITLRQFIVIDAEQVDATALWIAFTWFIDYVNTAPLMIINAPEKACGKTQLLDLVGRMSARPLPASNSSTAALFRSVELWKPTALMDEADTFIRENIELTGLINAGHTRSSAFVLRVVGENHEPKIFNLWSAKAFAGIALEIHLSDATMSRGVVINMRRKMQHESVTRIRHAGKGHFELIASKLARFAHDYSQQVREARPELPDELSDRTQDNWDPLVAIAECAGTEWVQRARAAALKLSSTSESSVSIGNELLADIQYIFESKCVEKITTADLINALAYDDERPWATYNRGKEISPRQLASLLNKYGIKSKTVRFNAVTPKGFDRAQFEDVFARYLP